MGRPDSGKLSWWWPNSRSINDIFSVFCYISSMKIFQRVFRRSFSFLSVAPLFVSLLFTSLFISCDDEDMEAAKELNIFVPYTRLELSKDSPSTTVNVSWNYCSNFEGYVVKRSFTRDGHTECECRSFPNETTSFEDTDCEPDTEYTYEVTADYHIFAGMYLWYIIIIPVESKGDSVKITTASDPKVCLDYPTDFKTSEVEGHTNALRLSWAPSEGATYYKVYMSSNLMEERFSTFEEIQTVTKPECTIYQLPNEVEYYFKVKAFGENGTSSVISTWVKASAPKATNLTMDTAYPVQNGQKETFHIEVDNSNNPNWADWNPEKQSSLWFSVTPEKGILKFYSDEYTVMLFSADGKLLKTNLEFTQDGEDYIFSFKDEIADFEPGKKYYLRFVDTSVTLLVE